MLPAHKPYETHPPVLLFGAVHCFVTNCIVAPEFIRSGHSRRVKLTVNFTPTFAPLPSGLRSVNSSSELCFDDAMKESTKPEEFLPPKPPVTPAAPSRVTKDGDRPSMNQVVLPLPGYDVLFPLNESKFVISYSLLPICHRHNL